jgi:hypothetical protein
MARHPRCALIAHMTTSQPHDEITQTKVNLETAPIAWKELLRFFAGGLVIAVSTQLDLVEVALQMSQDNKTQIEQWLSEGKIAKVSDELAKEWMDADAMLWAVVVKPWILVQLRTAC